MNLILSSDSMVKSRIAYSCIMDETSFLTNTNHLKVPNMDLNMNSKLRVVLDFLSLFD